MVFKSLLKTKHKAVILYGGNEDNAKPVATRKKVSVPDLRESFVNKLRYYIGTFDWDTVLSDSGIGITYRH